VRYCVCLFAALQLRIETRSYLHEVHPRSAASLRLTRGSSWIWRSRKAAFQRRFSPTGSLQPGRRCDETSGDVTSGSDIRITSVRQMFSLRGCRAGSCSAVIWAVSFSFLSYFFYSVTAIETGISVTVWDAAKTDGSQPERTAPH